MKDKLRFGIIGSCVISEYHAQQSIAAAKAGKHVLVEKIMAIKLQDATEMIHVNKEEGATLGVIYQKQTEEAPNRNIFLTKTGKLFNFT